MSDPEHNAAAFIAATAPLFAPGPQSHDTDVICPHCGHAIRGEGQDDGGERIECEECGEAFTVRASISITYHTTP